MQAGQPFAARDIFRQPLSAAELDALLALVPAQELFSWKSPSAIGLALDPATTPPAELRRLMLSEPRLIRRPLLRLRDRLLVGFHVAAWNAALAEG